MEYRRTFDEEIRISNTEQLTAQSLLRFLCDRFWCQKPLTLISEKYEKPAEAWTLRPANARGTIIHILYTFGV